MSRHRRVSESQDSSTNWIRALVGLLGVVVLVGGYYLITLWTRPPAVSFDNLKYIQLLRTAVSSQRKDYVDNVERALQLRKDEGKINETEWNHFQAIIKKAQSGDWQSADRACMDFEAAQLNRKR